MVNRKRNLSVTIEESKHWGQGLEAVEPLVGVETNSESPNVVSCFIYMARGLYKDVCPQVNMN